jgi:hypothetical protein
MAPTELHVWADALRRRDRLRLLPARRPVVVATKERLGRCQDYVLAAPQLLWAISD